MIAPAQAVIAPELSSPRRSEETRARILEAAIEIFRREGFEKTTMRQIGREAGVALGAAYYYYESKDALVMAFYERAQAEMEPALQHALKKPRDLRARLKALIEVKLKYFEKDRSLLGALSAHIDPSHPLSPFSRQTEHIRENDIRFFREALNGAKEKPHPELQQHLPKLLWMYQMGLLLYWTYDRSPEQQRSHALFEKTLGVVSTLIRISRISVLRPVRKLVRELMDLAYGEERSSVDH